MKPFLSILICSIPSRWDKAKALYNKLALMSEGKEIEVLMLMDNKKRTIGEKREALKNISNGKYFIFIDDDDDLFSVDELYEAAKGDVHVITFKVRCFNSDGSDFIVTYGLGNEIEHNTKDGRYLDCKRPPFHSAAWSEKFKPINFPALSYAEDWGWAKLANALAKTSTHIDKVLVSYNFDPKISEAVIEHDIANKVIKRVVVNLVTNKESYIRGQERLEYKMRKKGVTFIPFIGEKSVGAPLHEDNPYAFKLYAIEKVRNMGYDQILWLDASVYPVKPIEPVFDWLTKHGIFLEEAGHYAGRWSTQKVLDYFKVTREEANKMPMFSAGYCGFDFTNPISVEFFEHWKNAMRSGMFIGNWEESRHDMSSGSIIANKMGLVPKYSPGGQFFAYIGEGYEKPKDSVVFHLQGML